MIRFLIVTAAFIVPSIAWAQESVAPMSGGGWDTFATIYLVVGGIAFTGLGWLITWGAGKLKGTYAKEVAGKFLGLFNTGLQGAHAKFKMELEAARDPNSPGGASITKGELDQIRDHMWQYLKATYGNFDSISKAVGIFTGATGKDAVEAFVNSKIDAGVAAMERADKAVANPK